MSIKNGYSLCMNNWALDKEIKNELGLLLIISSYTAKEGFCFASNSHFAELFNVDEVTISRRIKKLEAKNYISIKYEYRGCEVIKREIRLAKMLTDDLQKHKSTINKNVKDNNISNNNKSIKNNMDDKISSLINSFLSSYKEICTNLPQIRELSSSRRQKVKARLKDAPLETWKQVFQKINDSEFCCGKNDRKWIASFDWIISNDNNYLKVLEGKYDTKKQENIPYNPYM